MADPDDAPDGDSDYLSALPAHPEEPMPTLSGHAPTRANLSTWLARHATRPVPHWRLWRFARA